MTAYLVKIDNMVVGVEELFPSEAKAREDCGFIVIKL